MTMAVILHLDKARRLRIVLAIAAEIGMDLRLGGADGAEDQRDCNE